MEDYDFGPVIFGFIGFIIGIMLCAFASWTSSSEPNEEQKKCIFCKKGVTILALRKGFSDERHIAKYCPLCGKKLPEYKDDEEVKK